jgi:hypothetical protein
MGLRIRFGGGLRFLTIGAKDAEARCESESTNEGVEIDLRAKNLSIVNNRMVFPNLNRTPKGKTRKTKKAVAKMGNEQNCD